MPAQPPSPERAQALAALGHGLMLAWRHEESLPICEQALALARAVGAHAGRAPGARRCSAATSPTSAAATRGSRSSGWPCGSPRRAAIPGLWSARTSALTDVLTMLGRPRESARLAAAALEVVRRYGVDAQHARSPTGSRPCSRSASGTRPTALSAAALRAITANYPHMRLIIRADARGRPRRLRRRAGAPRRRARHRCARTARLAIYDVFVAELALWERRWTDADAAVRDGLARARPREAAQIRVRLCAKGLRAQAELAALARARRDADAVRDRLGRARKLLVAARRAAAEAAAVTPNAAGWRALAEAEYERARGVARPELWSERRDSWERLERPPLAAYCRWRQAEALVAAGAAARRRERRRSGTRTRSQLGSERSPCCASSSCSPQRARLDLAPPDARPPDARQGLEELLGLTPREAEVLTLVARGLHQPRDRRRARDQRQDRQRPRLAHPAQARRAEPARGRRDRAPPRPAPRRRSRPGCRRPRAALRSGVPVHPVAPVAGLPSCQPRRSD